MPAVPTNVDIRVQCPECLSIYLRTIFCSGAHWFKLHQCLDCGGKWHTLDAKACALALQTEGE